MDETCQQHWKTLDRFVEIRSPNLLAATYPTTSEGIRSLLDELTCLQCRAVLLEWQSQLS